MRSIGKETPWMDADWGESGVEVGTRDALQQGRVLSVTTDGELHRKGTSNSVYITES